MLDALEGKLKLISSLSGSQSEHGAESHLLSSALFSTHITTTGTLMLYMPSPRVASCVG